MINRKSQGGYFLTHFLNMLLAILDYFCYQNISITFNLEQEIVLEAKGGWEGGEAEGG